MKLIEKYPNTLIGDRGWVILPIEDNDLITGKIKNIHLASIKPDQIRGNHFHKNKTEYIFIFGGMVEIVIKDIESGELYEYLSFDCKTPALLIARPKIAHAIKNIDENDIYLFCYGTESYDPNYPDVHNEKLIK